MMSTPQPSVSNTNIQSQQQQQQLKQSPPSSSISNLSTSIITILLILFVTLLATAILVLLLRRVRLSGCLSHCHQLSSTSSSVSSSSSRRHVSPLSPRNLTSSLVDSLPLFSFSSVASTDGDCAVCLSKFQPHDQLRLLPLCCHAFHAECVDSWLQSNLTCPLCRSNVIFSDHELAARLRSTGGDRGGSSFRLEIGSVSQRRGDSVSTDQGRSYSLGSFDYIVDGESEVSVSNGYSRSIISDKEDEHVAPPSTPPEASLAAEVGEERSWVRECMDRLATTLSSRTLSFRSSGRYFTGSSRRSELNGAGEWNLEAGSIGDEISELFRWASGV